MYRFYSFLCVVFLSCPVIAAEHSIVAAEKPKNTQFNAEQFNSGFVRGSSCFIASGWLILAGAFLGASRDTMLTAALAPTTAIALFDAYKTQSISKLVGYAASMLSVPIAGVGAIGWLTTLKMKVRLPK